MRCSCVARALAAVSAIALFAGCGGASPSAAPPAAPQNRSPRQVPTGECPCLYVADSDSNAVTVYATGATGNAKPIQNIHGASTGLDNPRGVAVDSDGKMYVVNDSSNTSLDSITVYAAGATGNAAPVQTILGSNTQLDEPAGIALNPVNGDIYVLNYTNVSGNGSITFYPQNANGNVKASGAIQGSSTMLYASYGIALDASGNIYNSNGPAQNSVTVFAAGSTGNVPPSWTIQGSQTRLDDSVGLALDSSANVYVTNYKQPLPKSAFAVTVYPAGSSGDVAPTQDLMGSRTKLNEPSGIAVDGSGNVYVANWDTNAITVYAPGATGNLAPSRTIKGKATKLSGPFGIAIR